MRIPGASEMGFKWFPETGVPPNHPLSMGFFHINHPEWGFDEITSEIGLVISGFFKNRIWWWVFYGDFSMVIWEVLWDQEDAIMTNLDLWQWNKRWYVLMGWNSTNKPGGWPPPCVSHVAWNGWHAFLLWTGQSRMNQLIQLLSRTSPGMARPETSGRRAAGPRRGQKGSKSHSVDVRWVCLMMVYIGILTYGGFHKWGYPIPGHKGQSHRSKWMIWD